MKPGDMMKPGKECTMKDMHECIMKCTMSCEKNMKDISEATIAGQGRQSHGCGKYGRCKNGN